MNEITNIAAPSINNIDSDIQSYVERFHGFANKSAESVLQMCKVVSDAKAKLSDAYFNKFCLAIGLNKDASAISKMTKIGKRFTILSQYKDHLPSAWTTLYRLSDMSDEAFKTAIESRQIHCNMTAKDLNSIAPSKTSGKKAKYPMTIDHVDTVRDGSANSFTLKSLEILKSDKLSACPMGAERETLTAHLSNFCRTTTCYATSWTNRTEHSTRCAIPTPRWHWFKMAFRSTTLPVKWARRLP